MVEEPNPKDFRAAGAGPLSMAGAILRAREEMSVLTGREVDAITRTERTADGGWIVTLDLIESVARMGDNDLLVTYEVALDPGGEIVGMERQGRYRREDSA